MRTFLLVVGLILVMAATAMAGQIILHWTGPTTFADGTAMSVADQSKLTYQACYGPTTGNETTCVNAGTGVQTYTITGLTNGATYYIIVTSTLNSLTSANSNEVTKMPPFVAPAGIVTLTAQ